MDRVGVVRPEKKLVDRAAQVAEQRIVGASGNGGASSGSSYGRDITQERIDEDGNVQTRHLLIWELDAWDDPNAVWADGASGLTR